MFSLHWILPRACVYAPPLWSQRQVETAGNHISVRSSSVSTAAGRFAATSAGAAMAGGSPLLLLWFSLGGVSFLLVSLHEALSPVLLCLRRRHRLRHLILLPFSLLSTFLPFLLVSPSPFSLSLSALSSLFLLHSLLPLLPPLPPALVHLLLLPPFLLELLLLNHLRLKDPQGVEHQYLSLLSLAAFLCAAASLLSALYPSSSPHLARSLALALHGSWLLQIAFSFFFPAAVAGGCQLRLRAVGDFTIHCNTHEEYHRGRALATLQFNAHLAALVILAVGMYWLFGARRRGEHEDYIGLTELGTPSGKYTVLSDDGTEEEEVVLGGDGGGGLGGAAALQP